MGTSWAKSNDTQPQEESQRRHTLQLTRYASVWKSYIPLWLYLTW